MTDQKAIIAVGGALVLACALVAASAAKPPVTPPSGGDDVTPNTDTVLAGGHWTVEGHLADGTPTYGSINVIENGKAVKDLDVIWGTTIGTIAHCRWMLPSEVDLTNYRYLCFDLEVDNVCDISSNMGDLSWSNVIGAYFVNVIPSLGERMVPTGCTTFMIDDRELIHFPSLLHFIIDMQDAPRNKIGWVSIDPSAETKAPMNIKIRNLCVSPTPIGTGVTYQTGTTTPTTPTTPTQTEKTLIVQIAAGQGVVSHLGTTPFSYGEYVTIAVQPATGYHFLKGELYLTSNGQLVGTTTQLTDAIAMTEDYTAKYYFEADTTTPTEPTQPTDGRYVGANEYFTDSLTGITYLIPEGTFMPYRMDSNQQWSDWIKSVGIPV